MASVNKAIIVGRLGKDPDMKYFQDGSAVCNFSVATSETWKDKTTGDKKEKTEWHRVTTFRRLAEICGGFLSKGSLVYIEGKLQTRQYEKDGQTHYTTEIIGDKMQMLDSKSQETSYGGNGTTVSSKPVEITDRVVEDNGYPQQHKQQTMVDDDIPF